jgi:hypothetical protein
LQKNPENSHRFPAGKHEKTPENPRKSPKMSRRENFGEISGNLHIFRRKFFPIFSKFNAEKHKQKKHTFFSRKKSAEKK